MNYFNVGKIVNTQGLQGEMRVLSVTDFAEERFKKGAELALFDEKDQFCPNGDHCQSPQAQELRYHQV